MTYRSSLDQALAFFAARGVAVTAQRELASEWSYFVPTASLLEYEEQTGRWLHAQQLRRFAESFGFAEQR
jgi:pyrroloquinoline quinone (PQQ) biosynthesis protein C